VSFVDFLIFLFGCTGLTINLVSSEILRPLREFVLSKSEKLGYLLSCPMCSGFWIGLVASSFFEINPVFGAATASFSSWFAANFIDAIYAVGVYYDVQLQDGELEDERTTE